MQEYTAWLEDTQLVMDTDLAREFEARISESATLVFRTAFSVLRNREDAEDVGQEVFAKAYRSFRSLRDPARFRAWIVRIAWRLAINRQRGNLRRSRREQVDTDVVQTTTAVDAVIHKERSERLWRAIDALPERLRIVTVLAGIEEHNLAEVARLLGVQEGTVKSRLFLARKQLRGLLK